MNITDPAKKVAVLYATRGGMGDVGKFAMALAKLEPSLSCTVIPVALSGENSDEGSDKGLHVDVEDARAKETIDRLLEAMEGGITKIDVSSESAEQEIAAAIYGADAVISCLGNREPSMERWASPGTAKVVAAMKTKKIDRLVSLSSMGIGKDLLKTTPLTVLWSVLLRTVLRSARRDLLALEGTVRGSGLDYALVRPMGLTPSEPPRGSCDTLSSRGSLAFMLSKSDAAAFVLREALDPTVRGREVTIGYAASTPGATAAAGSAK